MLGSPSKNIHSRSKSPDKKELTAACMVEAFAEKGERTILSFDHYQLCQ
jgi:hypothetical protein